MQHIPVTTNFLVNGFPGTSHMDWMLLLLAGAFEVGFTTSLKFSNNFKNFGWSVVFFICISLSFLFLNKAIQTIPIGTAYAVWTGIGAVGTALMGLIFFKEPLDVWRLLFIFTLIASIVGLKVVSTH
jgi:quaternary ammonium compound-resistance protein SugE